MTAERNFERLSEYFDGEGTPSDQADVTQWLDEDAQSRAILREYEQLSVLLKASAEQPAPGHLQAAILQQLERDSLLGQPGEPIHRPTVVAQSTIGSPAISRRRSIMAVGSVLVTVLAVSVVFLRSSSDRTKLDPSAPIVASQDVIESAEELGELESAAFKNVIEGKVAESVEPSAAFGAAAGDLNEQPPIAAASLAESFMPATDAPALEAAESAQSSLKFELKPGEIEIGAIVEALEGQGDDIRVVKLTVVDRIEGLRKLHVLLARHASEQAGAEKPGDDRLARQLSEGNGAGLQAEEAGAMVAVLVNLPESKLSQALLDLNQEAEFESLEVAQTVSPANLQQQTQLMIARPGSMNRSIGAARAAADVPPTASKNASVSTQPTGLEALGGGFGGGIAEESRVQYVTIPRAAVEPPVASVGVSGRQEGLAESAPLLTSNVPQPAASRAIVAGAGMGRPATAESQPQADSEAKPVSRAAPASQPAAARIATRQYRVLFVVIDRSGAAAVPLPQPAEPAPKDLKPDNDDQGAA